MGFFSKVAPSAGTSNAVNKDYVDAQNGNVLATATAVPAQPGAYAVAGPPPDVQAQRVQVAPPPPQPAVVQQEKSWMNKITGNGSKTAAPITQPTAATAGLASDNMFIPIQARGPVMVSCCPSCQQETRTTIRTYPTLWTWIACAILFIVFWPLCWVPLVLETVSLHTRAPRCGWLGTLDSTDMLPRFAVLEVQFRASHFFLTPFAPSFFSY